MLRKLLHHLLERRYHWRTVGFSELAELYANRLLRVLAVNMVSGVTGIYMYQLGYPVWFIIAFVACYFLARGLMALPAAYIVARIGPKHASLVSNFLFIPALLSLTQLSGIGIPVLVIFGLVQGLAVTLYNVSYNVAFSKVKHPEHVGKELGFMYMLEKVGTGLSPLLGGLIAYLFGPEATMVAACVVFVIAAGPLFLTPEAVMTHQRIMLRGFNWRATWRHFISIAAVGVDQVTSVGMWSLFVAIAIFGASDNIVYAQIGGLMSIAFIASLVFSRLYGMLIDTRKGGKLLQVSVVGDALLNMARPFASTPISVVFVNVINEAVTSGFAMPYLKGQYDTADSLPGYRIVYMSLMEAALCFGAALFGLVATVIVMMSGDIRGLQISYVVAGVAVLPIMVHGFKALRPVSFASR